MDELEPQIEAMRGKLNETQAQVRKMQSEKDKINDEFAKAKERHDGLVAEMTEKLRIANDRLTKFLSGGLSFSPAVATWEEALKEHDGDYAAAAKQYPELRDEYNKQKSLR